MQHYHDTEWGWPVADDRHLFEKLCLEAFQAGLSWRTILTKRPAFRRAFKNFDFARVARFDSARVQALLADASIVRHRGKIEAVIANAQRACEMLERHDSLAAYIWRYEPAHSSRPTRVTEARLRTHTTSAESKALARDLQKLGWRFVGPRTMYAFMQSMGIINDHVETCPMRAETERARSTFARP